MSDTRREFLLRAPRGAMEFVRCRSMDEAARLCGSGVSEGMTEGGQVRQTRLGDGLLTTDSSRHPFADAAWRYWLMNRMDGVRVRTRFALRLPTCGAANPHILTMRCDKRPGHGGDHRSRVFTGRVAR